MRHTFFVVPGMKPFHTSELINNAQDGRQGDTTDAFYRAHMIAATIAGNTKQETWVVHGDNFTVRLGFGIDSIFYPDSIFGKILSHKISSYFDFKALTWNSHTLNDERSRRNIVLLPHHKQEIFNVE
jgi:hypothetical protein